MNEPADSIQYQAAGDDEGGDVCPECKEWIQIKRRFGYDSEWTTYCNSCNSTGKLSVAVTRRLTGEYDPSNDVPF